ncbi:BofA domain protein [Natronomonas moolapensis 8.8.11]|uniref:BofA domain protein n=1 Tax=Natronomonas moolapensis (strain DSM 18674 / CECT 7526 / JCM 14361 / 8.8.11) TaxID=268739 RepID=M1XZQ3_NATM8|nr:pro-sigmaK processing inhibitor BofA family protein [Natronomonas moolapensis]CCQ35665.1 BofA domain protein [Natronomonas moolapensis 8.8.11]
MVTTLEIGLLVGVLALLFGAYAVIKTVKPFVVNAVVGVIVLAVASFLGIGVEITPVAVLVCAIGGIPGALLVILLAYLGVAFAGMAAPMGALALL